MEDITEYHWLKNRPDYERLLDIHLKKKSKIKAMPEFIPKGKKKGKRKSRKHFSNKYIPYEEQLRNPLWMKRREDILNKKGRRCSKCGSTHNLQVHHLRYAWGKMAWEYKDKDLIVLCSLCHEKAHCIDLDKEFYSITN